MRVSRLEWKFKGWIGEVLAIGREAKKMGLIKLIFCHPDSRTVGAEAEHIKEKERVSPFTATGKGNMV